MEVQLTPEAPAAHRFYLGMYLKAFNNPKVSEANRKALAAKIEEARTFGQTKGWNN